MIDLSVCDGTGFEVMLGTQCTVALKTLQAEPFNIYVGYSIYIKVVAQNQYGTSPISDPGNGAVMVSVPDAPFLVMNDASITDDSKIGLFWFDGATNGGSVILDYKIEWDQSIGFWSTLTEGYLDRAYQTTTTLRKGQTYTFRIYARNNVGFSDPSEELPILVAQVPD